MQKYKVESIAKKDGITCVVIMTSMGHRCGYVGVEKNNSLHGSDYLDIEGDFCVHGGLTYSGGSKDYPVKSSGTWWLGFDCAHLDDNPRKCSLEYVQKECEQLAKQIKNKS